MTKHILSSGDKLQVMGNISFISKVIQSVTIDLKGLFFSQIRLFLSKIAIDICNIPISDMAKQKTATQQQKFTGHQKLVISLLALTQFTVILDFMIMSPLGDFMMKALKMTTGQFGVAVSAYAFSAALSGILTAGFADRFDRKKLLLFFYTGFILGTLFCALAPSYPLLLMARIVTGLFGGVIGSISLTIVTDLFPLQMRGRAMGVIQLGFAASQVLGIPAGLYLANHGGWHIPFIMIVALAVIIAILVLRFLEPVDKHLAVIANKNMWHHYRDILTQKNYRVAFAATALISVGGFLIQPFASSFFINNLNVKPGELPVIFLFSGIASLVIMPVVGKLSDSIDKFKLFTLGTIWAMLMMLVYTHMAPMPLWIIIAVNILVFMGIMSRVTPASATISSVPGLTDRGAFMSINASLQQLAGGIAASLAGLIVVQKTPGTALENFPVLGYISVLIMFISLALMYRVSEVVRSKNEI